jgi:hypothetical protein
MSRSSPRARQGELSQGRVPLLILRTLATCSPDPQNGF